MPRSAADHAAHDELLIARLYGGDVDDRERARALELVAVCEGCAALYADVGAIADATAALPVPPRPRDFALTEGDAARLSPRHRFRGRLLGLGRRRSFGGAMVSLGFSGLVLTFALSIFGAVGKPASLDAGAIQEQRAAAAATAAPVPAPADNNFGANATAATAATAIPAKAPETASPAPSPAFYDGATPGAPAVAGGGTSNAWAPSAPPAVPAAATISQSGWDGREIVLGGSTAALALGMLFLLAPAIRRRLRGGARR
jgi:hypothetical protein